MAQHDYVISNGTGAAVRSDLNNALLAIVSQNSGATEPTTTYAYQWWADTTTGLLKIRNSANNAWITLRELDGTLTIEDGTVSAPGLAFRDDLNTGIWRPGTDQFAISTNGVERVEWGTSEVVFNDAGNNYDFRIEGDNNANLLFVDASADAVGIGTSTPTQLLEISNGYLRIGTDKGIKFDTSNSANDSELSIDSSGVISFKNSGGSSTVSITNAGNVGIGTTSPTDTNGFGNCIDIRSSTGAAIYLRDSDDTTNDTFVIGRDNSDSYLTSNSGNILFSNNGSERARIDSSGRLLVGTSSAGMGSTTTTTIVGGLLLQSTGLRSIASGGTLDLELAGTGNVGHLYVTSVLESNAGVRTNRTYFVTTRLGNATTITQLNTADGSSGGRTFTITNPSGNIYRYTDTSSNAGNLAVSIAFVGTMTS